MHRAKAFIGLVLLFGSAEAHTSDKGMSAEIISSCQRVFCESDLGQDLAPLLEVKLRLMRSKVSPETLAKRQREMAAMWSAVATKHKTLLEQLPLTARLGALDPVALDDIGVAAWRVVRQTCPAKHVRREAVLEFLRRRIPELASPTPDAGAGP